MLGLFRIRGGAFLSDTSNPKNFARLRRATKGVVHWKNSQIVPSYSQIVPSKGVFLSEAVFLTTGIKAGGPSGVNSGKNAKIMLHARNSFSAASEPSGMSRMILRGTEWVLTTMWKLLLQNLSQTSPVGRDCPQLSAIYSKVQFLLF